MERHRWENGSESVWTLVFCRFWRRFGLTSNKLSVFDDVTPDLSTVYLKTVRSFSDFERFLSCRLFVVSENVLYVFELKESHVFIGLNGGFREFLWRNFLYQWWVCERNALRTICFCIDGVWRCVWGSDGGESRLRCELWTNVFIFERHSVVYDSYKWKNGLKWNKWPKITWITALYVDSQLVCLLKTRKSHIFFM